MTIPKVTQTVQDKGLGSTPGKTAEICAVLACAAGGPINTPRRYAGGQTKKLLADFTGGVGVEAAAAHLDVGQDVVFMRLPSTTAGTAGTDGEDGDVDFTGTGTSVITITGAALDSYDIRIVVVTGGTIGTAGIKLSISLDGGRSFETTISLGTANTYVIPNTGLTLAFAAGTLVANDSAVAVALEPKWAKADLSAGFAALRAAKLPWTFIHLVGKCSADEAGTVKSLLTGFESAYLYTSAVLEARRQNPAEAEATWSAAIIADYADFVSDRIVVGAGCNILQSAVSRRSYMRPISWDAAVRACALKIHEDVGKVKAGPLLGTIWDSEGSPIAHDESTTPGLDDARFMTVMSLIGEPGVYVANPNTMAAPGSDFTLWQYRRVMDKMCAISYSVLVKQLSSDVRVDKKTGYIDEKDALVIESAARTRFYLEMEKPGSIVPGTGKLLVSRTDNILSNKTVNTTTRAVPLGYVKTIENDIGFTNPALVAVTA